jgi:hypothetical protein
MADPKTVTAKMVNNTMVLESIVRCLRVLGTSTKMMMGM